MKTTLKNMALILTLTSLTLASATAMAKGGGNGGNSSNNSSKSFSRSLSSKSLPSMGSSNGSQSFKSLKVVKSQGTSGPQLNSNKLKFQTLQGNSNATIKKMPKLIDSGIGNGTLLNGKNVIKKMPKVLDPGIGNGKGGKVVDPGFGKGNKGNFCKDFGKNKCFDKYCWPWWGFGCSPCYQPCYDPCYYGGCYSGCYGGGLIVVEQPVLVGQPVVLSQPVVAQEPVVAAAAVEPAKVAAPADALPKVPVGATITLRGEAFGDEAGKVAMQIGELVLPVTMTKWEAKAVTITLPQVGLAAAAKGKFLILKADGSMANEIGFELVAPQAPAVTQQ